MCVGWDWGSSQIDRTVAKLDRRGSIRLLCQGRALRAPHAPRYLDTVRRRHQEVETERRV